MTYTAMTEEDCHDVVVAFLHAQERDHFCHQINQQRYQSMLESLPAGAFFDRISKLLDETTGRLQEVGAILTATAKQLPDADGVKAALVRLKARGDL